MHRKEFCLFLFILYRFQVRYFDYGMFFQFSNFPDPHFLTYTLKNCLDYFKDPKFRFFSQVGSAFSKCEHKTHVYFLWVETLFIFIFSSVRCIPQKINTEQWTYKWFFFPGLFINRIFIISALIFWKIELLFNYW